MEFLSLDDGAGETAFVWAHGWGHNQQSMMQLAQPLMFMGRHYLVDLPGFGASPPPAEDWALEDYAAFMAEFIRHLGVKKVIWIGHSFGSRIGIKLASLFPQSVTALVLVAAPGLPKRRTFFGILAFHGRIWTYKIIKLFVRKEEWREYLRRHFGSADYKNAGAMRNIFMKVVRENLGKDAEKVGNPVLLIYGDQDKEAPPDVGERLVKLMPQADIRVLQGFDHYSILKEGSHQAVSLIKKFIEEKAP